MAVQILTDLMDSKAFAHLVSIIEEIREDFNINS